MGIPSFGVAGVRTSMSHEVPAEKEGMDSAWNSECPPELTQGVSLMERISFHLWIKWSSDMEVPS